MTQFEPSRTPRPWFIPDPNRGRPPVPYTEQQRDDWANKRKIGERAFVLRTTLLAAIVCPLTVAIPCVAIYLLERPTIDQRLAFLAMPYVVLLLIGSPALGWFFGTTLWHIGEDRYEAAIDNHETTEDVG